MAGYNQNRKQESAFDTPKVMIPLHQQYNDVSSLYLPEGSAWKFAEAFKQISTHQLRKILDSVKLAARQCDQDFEGARKQLFVLVALAAYNSGRDKKLEPLYTFMKQTINDASIKSKKDIKMFDQLFTSIIAYHKVQGGKD